jgi:hypothetical protein
MGMTREELELMWQLKRVLGEAGEFVLAFSGGDMDPNVELEFAKELAVLADGFRRHAVGKLSVVAGEVVGVVAERLALPVGESSTNRVCCTHR